MMSDDGYSPTNPSAGNAATGIPAQESVDQGANEPIGRPGMHHWRQAEIIGDRGSVFFAAVEMTRMLTREPAWHLMS